MSGQGGKGIRGYGIELHAWLVGELVDILCLVY